jgi:hypothetical protein
MEDNKKREISLSSRIDLEKEFSLNPIELDKVVSCNIARVICEDSFTYFKYDLAKLNFLIQVLNLKIESFIAITDFFYISAM